MLTAEAHLATGRASRYLVQLCRHADHMGSRRHHRPRNHGSGNTPPTVVHVEWSDTHGIINFGWGWCVLQAAPETLTVRAEAADEAGLRRIQNGIARRIETIGRRDHLRVTWHQADAPAAQHGEATRTATSSTTEAAPRRERVKTIALVAGVVLVAAVHLGLFGAALAASKWTSWGANVIVLLLLGKVLFMGAHVLLGRFAIRRGKTFNAFRPRWMPRHHRPQAKPATPSSAEMVTDKEET
jgi:hypothetical protein